MKSIEDLYPLLEMYARSELPREACGIIVRSQDDYFFLPCENIAEEKEESFQISELNVAAALSRGEVAAIFHSHPCGEAVFSPADKIACKRSGFNWLLYNGRHFVWLHPHEVQNVEILGRPFVWGVCDCYSLIRDFYEQLGIELADYPRPVLRDENGLFPWERENWSPYDWYFKKEGFYEVRSPQLYDVLIFSIDNNKGNMNHAGVYAGEGIFYHHLMGRLSEKTLLSGYWQSCLTKIVRHKNVNKH